MDSTLVVGRLKALYSYRRKATPSPYLGKGERDTSPYLASIRRGYPRARLDEAYCTHVNITVFKQFPAKSLSVHLAHWAMAITFDSYSLSIFEMKFSDSLVLRCSSLCKPPWALAFITAFTVDCETPSSSDMLLAGSHAYDLSRILACVTSRAECTQVLVIWFSSYIS